MSQTETAPSDRSTEFVAVEGGTETTSAGTLLVIAYLVMWAILAGFIVLSFRRLLGLSQRLDTLEKNLAKADAGN
jgi:CcmD family protein